MNDRYEQVRCPPGDCPVCDAERDSAAPEPGVEQIRGVLTQLLNETIMECERAEGYRHEGDTSPPTHPSMWSGDWGRLVDGALAAWRERE